MIYQRWGFCIWLLLLGHNVLAQEEDPIPPVTLSHNQTTLAERVPGVTKRLFTKKNRLALSPTIGLSFNDAFYRYITPGIALEYYVLETLALGVSAQYIDAITTHIDVVGNTSNNNTTVFNRPKSMGHIELSWLPLYGKSRFIGGGILHFDTFMRLGFGAVSTQKNQVSPSVTAALGQHYVMNPWLTLQLAAQAELYELARNPKNSVTSLQTLLSASLGLCFYFPLHVEVL